MRGVDLPDDCASQSTDNFLWLPKGRSPSAQVLLHTQIHAVVESLRVILAVQ